MNPRIEELFQQSSDDLARQDWAAAEIKLREILKIQPDLVEAHANLAFVFEHCGQPQAALESYQTAIQGQPDNARIHLNYGALLTELKLSVQAEASYRQALALAPEMPGAWTNLGALLALLRRDEEAQACFNHALAIHAEHALAHFNLACLLLRKGDYAQAWPHWEMRPWYGPVEKQLQCPRWHGDKPNGQRILVVFEGGFGDMIQFSRYVPMLREYGAAQVDVICHPALKCLLTCLPGIEALLDYDESLKSTSYDWWIPMMSLPCLFDTEINTIPAHIPYLKVSSEQRERWQTCQPISDPATSIKVGLVWRGSAKFQNDSDRSLPGLETLAPLWDVPGVLFFSFQKGLGEDEARNPPTDQPLINLAPLLNDFSDTAAAVEHMDLFITVDTSVAHLCGALGKLCWVLLPAYMTDWRWLEQRDDSPWYPNNMRLFRQARSNEWTTLVAEVHEALLRHKISKTDMI